MIPTVPSRCRLEEVVGQFNTKHIVVIGDLIADVFLFGEISRISREAPVMILREEQTVTVPGGAGNAAMSAAALGAQVDVIGLVGTDAAGTSLLQQMTDRGINCGQVCSLPGHRTPIKTRILAGLPGSSRQQVLRVDQEPAGPPGPGALSELLGSVEAMERADAIILSDYQYGLLDGVRLERLKDQCRASSVPWVADSRHRLRQFAGATAATPNKDEAEELLGERLTSSEALRRVGEDLRVEMGWQALLITLGGEGMALFSADFPAVHMDAIGSQGAVDVTGAGDTVTATFTLALGTGATFFEAAALANHAGGLVVMKRGTASITSEELLSSVRQYAK